MVRKRCGACGGLGHFRGSPKCQIAIDAVKAASLNCLARDLIIEEREKEIKKLRSTVYEMMKQKQAPEIPQQQQQSYGMVKQTHPNYYQVSGQVARSGSFVMVPPKQKQNHPNQRKLKQMTIPSTQAILQQQCSQFQQPPPYQFPLQYPHQQIPIQQQIPMQQHLYQPVVQQNTVNAQQQQEESDDGEEEQAENQQVVEEEEQAANSNFLL